MSPFYFVMCVRMYAKEVTCSSPTDYEADYLPNALRCRPVVILGLLSWPPFFIMIPSIIILFELNSIKHAISAITLCLIIMAWLESNCTSVFEKPLISKMLVMVAKALSAVSQSHFSGGGGGSPRRRHGGHCFTAGVLSRLIALPALRHIAPILFFAWPRSTKGKPLRCHFEYGKYFFLLHFCSKYLSKHPGLEKAH